MKEVWTTFPLWKIDIKIIDITGVSPCQRGVAGVCNDSVLYV